MKTRRRIWDLQSSTVCKVVGMALDIGDLRKCARKFGIEQDDPLLDEETVLHHTLVHLSNSDNAVSRHVDKLIERRFAVCGKKLSEIDPAEAIEMVRTDPEALGTPLWAVLWGSATRGGERGADIERQLFGFIHMLEHRLVREHWNAVSTGRSEEKERERKASEILNLKKALLAQERENKKLLKTNENLQARVSSLESRLPELKRRHAPMQRSEHACKCRCENAQKTERMRSLLQEAKTKNQMLEAECAQLREEVAGLMSELRDADGASSPYREVDSGCPCPVRIALEGKSVAMVGGIGSLEHHYRQMIEGMGGRFCRHTGECRRGEGPLEDCIGTADLVVCPIQVNSHNAAKSVKRICRNRGIACCFPRSASLTGLKRAVEEHYADPRVA